MVLTHLGRNFNALCAGVLGYRVFYAGWKDRSFYLFHGFLKKAQKTPRKELERANGHLAEMKERSQ
jgi:phage-related protein